jgi:UDP-2,3-diacylglucosamine hydrolase
MAELAAPSFNTPLFHELAAPAHWRSIDFISDLHLHAQEPANFTAWQRYLESSTADAIIILGDLFEVWVGDDCLHSATASVSISLSDAGFEDRCRSALHACSQHKPLYFMHGNRDFLVGPAALAACGMQLLPDPTVLTFGGLRYLLSHGDELCTADTDYQKFRALVRSSAWQAEFLARPLAEREQMARSMRAQSEARKQLGGPWVDLDPQATAQWMHTARADHMIHGHTHEGADHAAAARQGAGTRHVLCDWHADAVPPRAQVLRVSTDGSAANKPSVQAQRLPLAAAAAAVAK